METLAAPYLAEVLKQQIVGELEAKVKRLESQKYRVTLTGERGTPVMASGRLDQGKPQDDLMNRVSLQPNQATGPIKLRHLIGRGGFFEPEFELHFGPLRIPYLTGSDPCLNYYRWEDGVGAFKLATGVDITMDMTVEQFDYLAQISTDEEHVWQESDVDILDLIVRFNYVEYDPNTFNMEDA
uniref:Uncharacterized protein n=1 Tax=Attheya septentrionalis TaxID=420275 RepID=A0A7S2XWX7_9STRA|mmetsp:Transcript_8612/g.15625  ORF Transcript_8612/g.15625 Transcript_8612/m.15625 type:complete len:183 (+) Transcript_8612:258-806(+)|eukprot:CAMPEP_0198304102 /NCGR_PEP_ID=MMETSP1449-20131203/57229_1 /TAXON_ID=420275 /ORGANISM="Attheya septentrionalis, Strain CCMP2084" /LENGTH=182 /DNA_ID=CAMNT_0044006615 /DNA_START=1706 /DNA_END=2254 /DNA_ORIENTATION=-